MPLVVWGLDEIAESIVLVYAAIVGLLFLLVVLEQRFDQPTRLSTRRLRVLSQRYLDHRTGYPPELRGWLRRTSTWDVDALAGQLRLSPEQSGRILHAGGYRPDGPNGWRVTDPNVPPHGLPPAARPPFTAL